MKKGILAVILCVSLFLAVGLAQADNNARDYLPAPDGTILSILYWYNINGDYLHVNGKAVSKVNFTENLGMWREVYYFHVGPFQADAQVIVPFGHASLSVPGGPEGQTSTGIGDPIILGTIWFINNPQCNTYLGFSPYFYLPVGSYDSGQTLNIGNNRWAFREELALTKGWQVAPGHMLYYEVTTGGDFFTQNDDYDLGHKLSEKPIFNLESHLSYDLTKNLWIAADFYGHWGGEQSLDSTTVLDSSTESQTVGGTLAYMITSNWQVLLQYKGDVYVQNGIPSDTFLLRTCYITDIEKLFH